MRRRLASLLIALLSSAVVAAPASACLNDRESRSSEREFKSQYQESPGTDSLSPGAAPSDQILPVAATGVGGILVGAALGLTLCLSRRR